MTTINKNFFIAPSATGLGAMRWVATLLLAVMMLTTAQTAWATDKTLSGSENYTAQDGDVLTGSTSGTVTIAGNANITLNNSTINGGIVCKGSATITLVGTNSVSGATNKAGIQIGGSGTTLTIKGNGSLTANGDDQSAGIGLSRAWNPASDVTGGDIVIEGGNITANGGSQWGAGIGTGVIYGNGSAKTARIGNITIKGGTVKATGGSDSDGIGTGYTYYGCTNAIGTVTIYDGIDMVDASSIKNSESIVYMHDETDVTANASNYFTITEDGDRRIIAPKDDTDYIITIADDIEHGSLTGAATAKYMENVTITATPDLGYRLSRLVVKDADNNDVATTGNSFFMPKGNVTVSAVFEQGTHGTTEFAWGYLGQYGFVTEATIYDGVTTVELQQGQSYRILKYDEDSYRKFLLDNDIYNVTIPYSGGTGTFTYANGTNFRVDYNGESGYYDITMTDAGNGKWSVSILKTVGVIDNIPDQTYSGSAITPEPLVMAGSLNLTKGTDYEYSYSNNTNVGTATVTVTFKGDYASLGSVEKEFTIIKATPTVTAPTAIADLVYTGSAQALVTGGTTDVGDILSYCLEENGMYSADIPTGTNAGIYTVYYKVDGSDNWNAVAGGTVEVNIALALADAADNSDAITAHADKTLVVALSGCTLYKDGSWNTLCLPFDVDLTATDCPLYGATARTVTAASVSGTTLNLTFGDAVNTLEAGTPYIIKWDGDGTSNIENPVFEGVTIEATKNDYDTNAESVTTDERVRFVGTYKSTAFDAENKSILLMGEENTLYYPTTGAGIGAQRAYFKIGGDDSALLARRLTVFSIDFGEGEEEATGIVEVEANTSLSTLHSSLKDAWHTLDGRRLQGKPTQGGIYIKNGKKITVKQ
ncbi:MAG: hypothetical protein IJP47_00505 [Prevotella sp.]|nr:hypothetical protein [Prevotella sp.]